MIIGLLFSCSLSAAPVNVNGADASAIAKALKGVGTVRAGSIVKYREENGAFSSADDLIKVKGISRKIVEKNREDILLSDQ